MIIRILYIFVFALCTQMLYAEHLWGLSVDAATMCQLDNQSNTHMQAGGSVTAEIDYQYRKQLFVFYTGAAFNVYHVGQKIDDVYEYNSIEPFLKPNVVYDRKDKLTTFNLAFPFMFGIQYKQLHLAAGCKIYLKLIGKTNTKAQYDYYAEDDKFYDDFIAEQLHHQDICIKSDAIVRPDVRPRMEVGWILKQSYGEKDPMFRISLFAEYGVINTLAQNVYDIPTNGIIPTEYYFYQATDIPGGIQVNNLTVGLHLACMLEWPNLERKLNSTKLRY